jgi:hypothetical protein
MKTNGISHSERTEGTCSVAVPILNHFGEVRGSEHWFVSFNLTEEDWIASLRCDETGNRVSSKLGYRVNE